VKISTVDLYRYKLPLTAPLQLGASTVAHRRGVLLRIRTEQGATGWGDAAPLPGFSSESLADVIAHARAVVPRWIGTELAGPGADRTRFWQALPSGGDAPPSFRFATESARVDLFAATRGLSVPEGLEALRSDEENGAPSAPRPTVGLNALITNLLEEGPEQARQCRERGYRAVKVKVGRAPLDREVDALRRVRAELGAAIALRADANRAWSVGEAVAFAEATRELDVAYVEEPLASPSRLAELAAQTDLPIALDETTRQVGPEVLRDGPPVRAVVLKPTLLGLREAQAWSRAATAQGSLPVLSASYESGVGLRMLVALAAVGPDVPVGLSTYDRLAADVLQPPLPMEGPTIDVAPVVDPRGAIDADRLDRLDAFSA
jgi:O-succinylbenzoate synthase